jgi:hypothetical protein
MNHAPLQNFAANGLAGGSIGLDRISEAAARRSRDIGLHSLVQVVVITDDRRGPAAKIADQVEGPTPDDALSTPFLSIRTPQVIVAHLHTCRAR